MKKTPATVLLIIFNAIAFFAGIYTAFASGEGGDDTAAFLWRCAFYLAVVPAPLAFVCDIVATRILKKSTYRRCVSTERFAVFRAKARNRIAFRAIRAKRAKQ